MRLGLIGRSLGYSKSPEFFNARFRNEQIDGQYQLIELCDIDHVPDVLEHGSFTGLNVTIPYKAAIIPYLDGLTEAAIGTSAVNCIYRKDQQWIGENTDVDGIRASLDALNIPALSQALVFGNGGASRAVRYVLSERAIPYTVVSRQASEDVLAYGQLTAEHLKQHKLLIQCTPVGTYPDVEKKINIPYSEITENHILLDLIYNPGRTAFMSAGLDRGARVLGGMLMLKTQAERAWSIWTRHPRP